VYIHYIMSEWSKLVAKLCKENPGKPLGAILVEAKKQYKPAANNKAKTKDVKKKSAKKSRKNRK
jgi:hypothetical protein